MRVVIFITMSNKHATYQCLSDVLQQALIKSGLSFHELERQTGLKRQSLMKFAKGEQSLRLDMADRLADTLGIIAMDRSRIADVLAAVSFDLDSAGLRPVRSLGLKHQVVSWCRNVGSPELRRAEVAALRSGITDVGLECQFGSHDPNDTQGAYACTAVIKCGPGFKRRLRSLARQALQDACDAVGH